MTVTIKQQSLHFAVGCFHFALHKAPPLRLTVNEYAEQVKSAVQALPTVNNVVIEVTHEGDTVIEAFEKPETLNEGVLFPYPHFFSLSFDLYIPYRIQAEVFQERRACTEHFRLFVSHEYHCPVCFVQPLNPTDTDSPSSCVPIVREYLERELNKPGAAIWFETLGPSPFHADFHLVPSDKSLTDKGELFETECLRSRGYADVTISYDKASFKGIDEAFEHLRHSMDNEFDAFYEIKRVDVESYRQWNDLQEQMENIIDVDDESIGGRLRRRLLRSKRLQDIHQALTEFDAFLIFSAHAIDQLFRGVYKTEEPFFLRSFLEAAIKDRPVFPTEQIGRLILFMEDRRSKAMELLIVLVAAVIGGVAGSLVTLLKD